MNSPLQARIEPNVTIANRCGNWRFGLGEWRSVSTTAGSEALSSMMMKMMNYKR